MRNITINHGPHGGQLTGRSKLKAPAANAHLSVSRVRFRVMQIAEDANALADELKTLAPYAKHPVDALMLAAAVSKVAITAIGPGMWGGFFQTKDKEGAINSADDRDRGSDRKIH
jgi:hypothetical protein